MIFAPGSLGWLMAHDARLGARRFDDLLPSLDARQRRIAVLLAAVVLHLAAWPAARWIASAGKDPSLNGLVFSGLGGLLAFAGSWMVAQSLLNVTRSLYVRGDLDLMLSAPMTARRVVSARMVGLAVENFGSAAFFLLPIAHALALQGHVHWLGIYPVLLAMSLAGAAIGLAVALVLFHLMGARRARTVAQVIAMLIGALVALGIQAVAVLPADLRAAFLSWLSVEGVIGDGRLPLPLAAVNGEPAAVLAVLAAGLALFLLAIGALSGVFIRCGLRAAGADLSPRASSFGSCKVRFSSQSAASIRAKEARLLIRDPWILGQLFLQVVYTLPVGLILWRSGIGAAIPAVAVTPSLVIIAAQLSGSLAWIAISGEDAPEFMATAPVSRRMVERRKLEVIARIVGAILFLPIALLTVVSPIGGLIAVVSCALAGASCALVNLWHPTDGRRRAFMRRHAQSKLIGLFEHALLLLCAIAAALAQMGTLVALAPALLAGGVLWLAWWVLARSKRPAAPPRPAAAPLAGVPQALS